MSRVIYVGLLLIDRSATLRALGDWQIRRLRRERRSRLITIAYLRLIIETNKDEINIDSLIEVNEL